MRSLLAYDKHSTEIHELEDLCRNNPSEFVAVVVSEFDLDSDFRKIIKLIKEGVRADKTYKKRRFRPTDKKPGDWIVPPYPEHLLRDLLLKSIKSARLVKKGEIRILPNGHPKHKMGEQ